MDYNEYIDVASAKDRFMGNEQMFKHFLYQLPERDLFQNLVDKLEEKNVEEAFAAAHTIKGLVGNLSLSGLGQRVNPVVEALRAGNLPSEEEQQLLKDEYEKAIAFIEKVKEQDLPLFS
ncbi:MAG: Hpt domain-containing protein [Muribaculaceae bacterium]|nr:Hpt domain-containing protein [Roseburia sp.]MCM1431859.1 Hpt domain-containing protein [Muribaculaceae bacterium]MCM1493419.1 Hpt domain-containing protein [Muribaculaceae bacterium]